MKKTVRHEGRWLSFAECAFTDATGREKAWEFVTRKGGPGACTVVAVTSGADPKIVLIRQFRPPVGAAVLEFPAGLVEAGENVGDTALRELEEETGCVGRLIEAGPPVYSSPGLTDETVCWVKVEVTGETAQRPEADEAIEVVQIPLRELDAFLARESAAGTVVDAKLWFFAQGLRWGNDQ